MVFITEQNLVGIDAADSAVMLLKMSAIATLLSSYQWLMSINTVTKETFWNLCHQSCITIVVFGRLVISHLTVYGPFKVIVE